MSKTEIQRLFEVLGNKPYKMWEEKFNCQISEKNGVLLIITKADISAYLCKRIKKGIYGAFSVDLPFLLTNENKSIYHGPKAMYELLKVKFWGTISSQTANNNYFSCWENDLAPSPIAYEDIYNFIVEETKDPMEGFR